MQFTLPEIPVKIKLGVTEEERATPQEIFIELRWQTDTSQVEISDDINDAINYFEVREWTMNWSKGKSFATIEKCLFHFKKEIQKKFSKMENLSIALTKIPEGEFAVIAEL